MCEVHTYVSTHILSQNPCSILLLAFTHLSMTGAAGK